MKTKGRKNQPPTPATPQPASPTTAQSAISFPDAVTIRLTAETPLQIKLASPEKIETVLSRPMLIFTAVFVGLCFLWGAIYLFLIAPRRYSPLLVFERSSLNALVSHPQRMSFGDEAELEITLINQGREPFDGSLVVLFNDGATHYPTPLAADAIKIEKLPGQSRTTQRVKFTLPQQTRFCLLHCQRLNIGLQAQTDKEQYKTTAQTAAQIAPLPYLRTINNFLFGSTVLMAIAGLLGRVFVKHILRWEEKG